MKRINPLKSSSIYFSLHRTQLHVRTQVLQVFFLFCLLFSLYFIVVFVFIGGFSLHHYLCPQSDGTVYTLCQSHA